MRRCRSPPRFSATPPATTPPRPARRVTGINARRRGPQRFLAGLGAAVEPKPGQRQGDILLVATKNAGLKQRSYSLGVFCQLV